MSKCEKCNKCIHQTPHTNIWSTGCELFDCKYEPNSFERGRLEEIRKFAEWLLHHSMLCDSFGQDLNDYDLLSESEIIEMVLKDYEKEQK